MIAYYGSKISKHMTQTPEGFLICRDVPVARIGTQDYLARELGLDGEPDRPVTVERRPEDVFDPAAIASFEGKDVTYTHPPEMLAPENQSAYSKGHAEGDSPSAPARSRPSGFLSTPSSRRATRHQRQLFRRRSISILALREEGDEEAEKWRI